MFVERELIIESVSGPDWHQPPSVPADQVRGADTANYRFNKHIINWTTGQDDAETDCNLWLFYTTSNID